MQHAEALLTCQDLLDGHADFLDGSLPTREARRFEMHLQLCQSCQRYDRVVRRGLLLARNLPEIQPSDHFHEKLQARLMNLDLEPPRQPIMASSATALVVAAVLAVIALTPLLRMVELERTAGSQAARTPLIIPTSFVPVDAQALVPTPPAQPATVLDWTTDPSFYLPVDLPAAVPMAPITPMLNSYPTVQAVTNR